MSFLTKGKKLSKSICFFVVVIIFAAVTTSSVFAVGELVTNEESFNPVSENQTQNLQWDKNTRNYNDSAYTTSVTGSDDHIILQGNDAEFYGYAQNGHFDYLYYKETDGNEKKFEFTIDQMQTDYHTLNSFGFFINCVENNDETVSGYFLSLESARIAVYKFESYNLKNLTANNGGGDAFAGSNKSLIFSSPIATGTGVADNHEFVLKSSFNAFSIERNGSVLFSFDISTADDNEVPSNYTGGNDFGLYAAYSGHNCSSLSYAFFTDIKLYTTTVTPQSKLNVEAIDYTTHNNSSPTYMMDTYVATGYVGQGYTINLPDFDKCVFVEASDSLTGEYGIDDSVVKLFYVRPTYTIQFVDSNGNVIAEETIDGLDLTTYTLEAKGIDGYVLVGDSKQTITLTADNPHVDVKFVYAKRDGASIPSPKTGESNTLLIVAGIVLVIAVVAVIVTLVLKKKKSSGDSTKS